MDEKLKYLRNNYKLILEIEQCNKLKNITRISPYSMAINTYIFSITELEIYKELNLTEGYITRPCLLADIDINYTNKNGKTNLERMLAGKPPIDPLSGKEYLLHHIGQQFESPYAELPKDIHAIKHFRELHKYFSDSWRIDRRLVLEFNKDISKHWILRGEMYICQ